MLILNALPGIGPLGLNRLLRAFGDDPKAVLDASAHQLAQIEGVRPSMARSVAGWRARVDVAREEANLARSGANFLVKTDDGYPRLLREIHDPPIGLYKRGSCELGETCIAVVGSRRASHYGLEVARLRQPSEIAGLSSDERSVLECLGAGEILTPDAISHRTRLAPEGLGPALMMLELKRLVAKRIDGAFESTV